ncbi:SWIM zinc finger family protein [Streptomyces sp. NBC_00704]|nr:SWIM zinc finger family protein [Streptomyces sp. NBC_00704]
MRQGQESGSPADEVRRALRAARERRGEPQPSRTVKGTQGQSPETPSATERTLARPQGRRADGPLPATGGRRTDPSPEDSAPSPADAVRAALRRTAGNPATPPTAPTPAAASAPQTPSTAGSSSLGAPGPIAPDHTADGRTASEGDDRPAAPVVSAAPTSPSSRVPAGPRPGDVAREALRAARAQARQGAKETEAGETTTETATESTTETATETRETGRAGERAGREREGARTGPRIRPRPRPERGLAGDRIQGQAPDPVARERARAVRDVLAGAFRMPTDEPAEPDTDVPSTIAEPADGSPAAETRAAMPGVPTSPPPPHVTDPVAPSRPGRPPTASGATAASETVPSETAPSPTPSSSSPTPTPTPTPMPTPTPSTAPPTAAPATAAQAASTPSVIQGNAPARPVEAARAPRSMAAPSRDGDHRRTFPAFPPRAGGAFAETWWGNAWVAALEEGALDVKRLARGRGYAEQGNVDAITVTPGLVLAYVQGSRPRPYRVQVRLRTLGGDAWERFLDAAVERPGHIAALLDKEMPESLADCGVPLLPGPGDLEPQCSCPDRGHPCKHAAALCYQTARLLDADPFVLLLLRGRGEREVLDALSRRNAVRAARAAQEQEGQPEPLAGVRAAEVLAERRLPPLPAPLPPPAHPEQPPAYPSAPNGPDAFALDHLATDAAARAHTLLTTGRDQIGGLTLWQDAVRLAASRPGSGLTAATRSLYASLASAAGRTPSELARAVAAWRQGGPDGLTVLEETWDPPAGRFDRARPLLLAADLPAFRPRRNHLTHPRGHVQLRYGQDGLWYAYESEPGEDDWWPRGTPDSDPVGALTGLGASDDL